MPHHHPSPRFVLLRVISLRVISWIVCLLLALLCSCAKVARRSTSDQSQPPAAVAREDVNNSALVNLNTASAADLEKLPGIGHVLAERIIAHREHYGPFRRAEHLMMVQGISDHRFRAIRDLVTVQ